VSTTGYNTEEEQVQTPSASLNPGLTKELNVKLDDNLDKIKQSLTTFNKTGENIETLSKQVEKLVKVLEERSEQKTETKAGESAKVLSDYEKALKGIERKYNERSKSGLGNTLLGGETNKAYQEIRKQRELKQLKADNPEEAEAYEAQKAAEEKEKRKKARAKRKAKKEEKVQAEVEETTAVPAPVVGNVAKVPEAEKEQSQSATGAITEALKPVPEPDTGKKKKTPAGAKPLKIELYDVNKKVLDKLEELFNKVFENAGLKKNEEAQDAGATGGGFMGLVADIKQAVQGLKGSGKAVEKTAEKAGEKAVEKAGEKVVEKAGEKAIEKAGEKAGEKALEKAAVKAGEKTLGKSLLKKIPLIGLAAGGVFAAQRAFAGDWLGASGELASGALSMIPGLGTAGSIAIDAALAGRDVYKATHPEGSTGAETSPEITPESKDATTPLPPVQGESALKEPATAPTGTPKIEFKSPVVPEITPEPTGPTAAIATTPSPEPEESEEGSDTSGLEDSINALKETIANQSIDGASVNSNVSSNSSGSTVYNIRAGAGEEINSSRNKTDARLTRFRALA